MKLSSLVGSAATLLLTGFPCAKAVPVDALVPRDFSADLRNFHQIQQLMHNLRSRIGVPFSAMRNVGLPFHQTLEVKPLDLVLLPSGYCFSCSSPPHTEPDQSKPPNPFHNEMVELDESQLLVACTDNTSDAKPDEWPLVKACPGQEKVLRDFLFDVCGHGSRLAIPKARLEKAPVFQVDKRTCMPMDSKQTTCSTTPSSITAPFTISPSTLKSATGIPNKSGDPLQNLLSSIYQRKSLPATTASLATTSTKISAGTKTPSASAASAPTLTKPEATSTSSSASSPPKPTKLPTLTLTKRRIAAPSNYGPPDPAAWAAYASAATVAGLQREKDYWNAMHSMKASEASAQRAAAASESAFSASRKSRHTAASANAMDAYHSHMQTIQDYRLSASVFPASAAALSSSKEHKLAARAQKSVQAPSSIITVSFLSTTIEHEVIVSTKGYPNGHTVVPRPAKSTKSLVARAPAVEATQAAVSTSGISRISASIAALSPTKADQLLFSTPLRQESDLEESSAVCTSILLTTIADKVIEDRHRVHHHHHWTIGHRPCLTRPTYSTMRDPLWRDPNRTPIMAAPTRAAPPTTRTTTVVVTAGPQLLSSINSIYRQWGVPTLREFRYEEVEKKTFGIP